MRQLRDCLPDAYIAVLESAWARDGLHPSPLPEPSAVPSGALTFEVGSEGGPGVAGPSQGGEAS